MRTRVIRDAVRVSELGLGTAQFGNLSRVTTDAEAAEAFDAAWDAGVRHFDTAPHYGLGLSERRLGKLLASRKREDYVISTKVGRLLVPNPGGATLSDEDAGFAVRSSVHRRWDFSAEGVRRSLEQSLERLGLDRVDIAYLHDPDEHGGQAIEEAIPALIEMRQSGLVSAVGAGMNQSALPAEFVRRTDVDVIMLANRFTLLEQGPLRDLLPLAQQRRVAIVVAGAYNSGLLASERPKAGMSYDYRTASADMVARASLLAERCEAHGTTLPAAALAFPLLHPAVVSVVVGARDGRQVATNAERYRAIVPTALWHDLIRDGLLPGEVATWLRTEGRD